ncbi:MAG: GGDEF and EAL domain-containing protein, partial [Pseudomonadota bacterium]
MSSTFANRLAAPAVLNDLSDLSDRERERVALSASGVAVYEWRASDGAFVWAETAGAFFEALGLEPIASDGALDALIDRDAGECPDTVREALKEGGGAYAADYRIMLPTGEMIWVEDTGQALIDEAGNLVSMVGSWKLVTERKRREEYLTFLANYDELTGLYNRARLLEVLGETIEAAQGDECEALFLVVGIDDLAVVNSSYGFEVADEVIISVGQRLRAQLKPEDSVGRVAGNKFGLVLRDVCAVQVDEMCNHFLTTVGRSVIRTKAGPVSATVSIGAVCLPSGARSKNEAVACAEHALTEAKHQGRGCFQKDASSEDTYSERQRNIAIADNIVAALNEKRLHLAYQTIVAAGGFEPVFHEALIRLVHRDGHVAAAGEFIPAAEQLGMIRLLDRRTLELVVTELHQYGSLQLSMNVSAMTATDPSWADYMIGFLRDNQAICPRLIVEITETMALGDLAASARFVRSLRELGCLIAIDDFGAGYTSFKNLRSLDVTMVKLDGMFISNLDSNPDNQHFVRALIDLARNLGIKTVAEWVDRPEEIELLQSYGVDYLQGFYFSKPTLKP